MKKLVACAMAVLFVSFSAWGQKAVEKADILKDPEWKKIYDDYVPDAGLIATLKSNVKGLKSDVYFAFWCDDSKNHLPVFLKIMDAIAVPEFKVNFYEVERKAAPDQKFYVEDMLVEKVPTFIFYADDCEIGRIVENPMESILQDMMAIIL
ncbi:MAG: thioredoxin family protein [Acidobacteriota bacterium]|nr:thioredoxin family protein [Acidobacteriota bacterium]